MATLTANTAISNTNLVYRGSLRDVPYTGSVAIRSIATDCDGSMVLYWENGILIGQFWSTKRTLDLLSDETKLTYSADKTVVTRDPTPIQIKAGSYYVRFYPGSSAYYTHAAIRSSCGCGWCPEPCDRIWKVGSGSIQSLHDTEKRLPEYDAWIPMAYYLGVYGDSYSDAQAKGNTSPIADNSTMFSASPIKLPLDSLGIISGSGGGSGSSGGGGTSTVTGFTDTPTDLEFLDVSAIDFCADVTCEPTAAAKGNTTGPKSCTACGKPAPTKGKPQSGDCGCR